MPGARNGPSFINLYLFSFPCAAVTCQISCAALLTHSLVPCNRGGWAGNQRQELPLIYWGHTAGKCWFAGNQGIRDRISDPTKNCPKALPQELHTITNKSDQSYPITTMTELPFIDHRFITKQESCDQVG